jgi:hypothetical protein
MLIFSKAPGAEPTAADMAGAGPWSEEMDARGVRLMGAGLRSAARAVSVQVRGDEVLRTDGPFAETKEVVAGFDLLDCADLAEAIEVASRHPAARIARLELREIWAG